MVKPRDTTPFLVQNRTPQFGTRRSAAQITHGVDFEPGRSHAFFDSALPSRGREGSHRTLGSASKKSSTKNLCHPLVAPAPTLTLNGAKRS
jgi:hypothetical protein